MSKLYAKNSSGTWTAVQIAGVQGPQGIQGPQGEKGDKGDQAAPTGYTFATSSWSGSSSSGYTCTITLTTALQSGLNVIAQVYRLDSSNSKYTTVIDTLVTINSTTSITLSSPFAYNGKVVVIG